jgi:hypothetical protein
MIVNAHYLHVITRIQCDVLALLLIINVANIDVSV